MAARGAVRLAAGRHPSAAAEGIRARYTASRRAPLTVVLAGLGASFVAIGIIWLVATNLDRLSPLVRFGAVLLLWLALVVAAEVLGQRLGSRPDDRSDPADGAPDDWPDDPPDDRDGGPARAGLGALRLLAAAAAGAVIFQAAQSLQVPAYTSGLLGWWALGAVLYAYAVLGLAPLVLGVMLGTGWAVWAAAEGAAGVVEGTNAVLAAAVLGTAVAVLHTAARTPWAGAGGVTGDAVPARTERLAAVWRRAAAVLALGGLFVAALPLGADPLVLRPGLAVLGVAALLLAGVALGLGGTAERFELILVLATAVAGGLLLAWQPEGDLGDPTPALTARPALHG